MGLFPTTKKEPDKVAPPELPQIAGPQEPSQLQVLTQRLGALWQELGHLNEQVLDHLAQPRPETPAKGESDGGQRSRAVEEKIDGLAAKVGQLCELFQRLRQETDARLQELFQRLRQENEARIKELLQALRPPEPVRPTPKPAAPAPGKAELQRALLGSELAEHPSLDFQRQQLFDGILEGNPAACCLVGQLLVFQSASAEKMPKVLSDIGEAYYRWQPKTRPGNTTLETTLAHWLQRRCEAAGVSNTIELVGPGERFDAQRHNAATRGVEICEVHGWVVLRGNGTVYTKANVAVK
jgi:hypothetical protein